MLRRFISRYPGNGALYTVMGFRDGHFYVPWVMIALP
jgi:hypothetical protein